MSRTNLRLRRRPFRFFIMASATLAVLFPMAASANEPSSCESTFSVEGSFFINYENAEYSPDGFLAYHFRNNPSGVQLKQVQLSYFTDECNSAVQNPLKYSVSLPVGVTDWSVRFSSGTHFDVWDDQHEVIVIGFDIPAYPSYISAKVVAFDTNLGHLASRILKINKNGSAPVFVNQLETPPACQPFSVTGPIQFFDGSYQMAEYVDGLLRVHLRLRPPITNSFVAFRSATVTADADCLYSFSPSSIPSPNTLLPPYVRYFSFRMTSPTHWTLWDDEHDVPITGCSACSGDIPPGTPFVFWYASTGVGGSTVRTTPFPPEGGGISAPVIVIPGILGSAEHNGEWIIDPILHVYDNLINTFLANGYENGVTLFTFPYQWRDSNIDTAVLLKQKIDEVKSICSCPKVDIVAHSMGGLVARQYIQSLSYADDVRRLVFLGVPHLGAPKDYLMWEGGEVEPGFRNQLIKIFFTGEALRQGYSALFNYVRQQPIYSIQELLPVFNYLKNADGTVHPDYPTDYPRNVFLEQLQADIDRLYSSGVDIANFVGLLSSDTTIENIRVVPYNGNSTLPTKWEHGYPENFSDSSTDQGLEKGMGDSSVPQISADSLSSPAQLFSSDHIVLVSDTSSSTFKFLTGNYPDTVISRNFIRNLLYVRVFSPVDFSVMAPDGNRVGTDALTGEEVNEIPGAFYSGSGTDDELVTIPDPLPGEYSIFTEGTATGEYKVEASYVSDATTTSRFFSAQTLPGLVIEQNVNLDPSDPSGMTLVPSDVEPPLISIEEPALPHYPRSDQLPIRILIFDETGVASSTFLFDGKAIAASTTVDSFFERLGDHVVTVFAEDFVHNTTTTSKIVQIIATIESTISDVNRAFALGWITSEKFKRVLLSELRLAAKIEERIEDLEKWPLDPRVAAQLRLIERFDKLLMNKILDTLKVGYKYGFINQQGYNLLVEDTNWLLKH